MLTINIICVGTLKEKYFIDAAGEYIKRLSSFCKLTISEVDEERLPKNHSTAIISNVMEQEGQRILQKTGNGSFVVPLCIEGKQIDSEEFAKTINNVMVQGKSRIDFIIGGSCGLSPAVKAKADYKLSLSKMTLPHQLARVVLLEQIYRAFQILGNGKYHK
ncbi:MAG: 23S rRNA (pseudouridine(1915)-N(3))-methyltransferase RlmH [Oscillospiraceae bacterium]|nr:23S rRNA (pseudouridine(1915)-N(3))-methyltransferase RlmH [Oscillospiraceae bacterium]